MLWTPPAAAAPPKPVARGLFGARRAASAAVAVPPLVAQFLRPHQRVGAQFLYDCVAGLQKYQHEYQGFGAILADDMGLGKTLQTVALVYSLLQSGAIGPDGDAIRRVVVACPCSLVGNWKAEFDKWINKRASTRKARVECKAVDGSEKTAAAVAAFRVWVATKMGSRRRRGCPRDDPCRGRGVDAIKPANIAAPVCGLFGCHAGSRPRRNPTTSSSSPTRASRRTRPRSRAPGPPRPRATSSCATRRSGSRAARPRSRRRWAGSSAGAARPRLIVAATPGRER